MCTRSAIQICGCPTTMATILYPTMHCGQLEVTLAIILFLTHLMTKWAFYLCVDKCFEKHSEQAGVWGSERPAALEPRQDRQTAGRGTRTTRQVLFCRVVSLLCTSRGCLICSRNVTVYVHLILRLFIKNTPRPECTPLYFDKPKKWNLVRAILLMEELGFISLLIALCDVFAVRWTAPSRWSYRRRMMGNPKVFCFGCIPSRYWTCEEHEAALLKLHLMVDGVFVFNLFSDRILEVVLFCSVMFECKRKV